MGGCALAPDTTKAATRDCALAMRARMSHCAQTVEAGTVPKRVQVPSVADCRDTTVQARVRTETSRCGAMTCGVSPGECCRPVARQRGRSTGPGAHSRLGPEVCRLFACWPATSEQRQACDFTGL